jgi:hypothetical protein
MAQHRERGDANGQQHIFPSHLAIDPETHVYESNIRQREENTWQTPSIPIVQDGHVLMFIASRRTDRYTVSGGGDVQVRGGLDRDIISHSVHRLHLHPEPHRQLHVQHDARELYLSRLLTEVRK